MTYSAAYVKIIMNIGRERGVFMKIGQNGCTGLYRRSTCNISNNDREMQGKSCEAQPEAVTVRADSVEISRQGLEFCSGDGRVTASSGSDILEAEMKADKKHVSVYFSDSAMVSRAVKRGFIEINGNKVILSDEVKEKLINTDKQAQKAREAAFALSDLRHNLAVAQQQSEVLNKNMKSDVQAFSISAKMSNGSQVSPEEESHLLKSDPEMYLMAKIAQQMAKHKDKDYDRLEEEKPSESQKNDGRCESFTTYRTKMDVDISSGTVDLSSIQSDEKEISV